MHEQLFGRGVFAEVSGEIGVQGFPLAGGHTEKRKVEQVGFRGVNNTCLPAGGKTRRDEVHFNGAGVNVVINFGKRTAKVPVEFVAAFEGLGFF